jgi:hypothetical protein
VYVSLETVLGTKLVPAAMARTVDVLEIVNGCVYRVDAVEGVLPSVV